MRMAVAYRMLNSPQDGLRNDQEALAIWRSIGQKRGIASSLNEIARTRSYWAKTRKPLDNFQQALQIRRDIGDKRGLGDTLIDLGNFYDDRGDHDQALKMYKESLQIERDIGNEGMQADLLEQHRRRLFCERRIRRRSNLLPAGTAVARKSLRCRMTSLKPFTT